MKPLVGTVAMLLLSGCGTYVVQVPAECAEETDCALCKDGADCNIDAGAHASSDSQSPASSTNEATADDPTPAGTTVIIPAAFATHPEDPVSEPSTAVDPLSSPLPLFDPFAPTLLPLADIDILLSLFLDGLVLDLLAPADLNSEMSYLERLCREGDIPEFICRQRFANVEFRIAN